MSTSSMRASALVFLLILSQWTVQAGEADLPARLTLQEAIRLAISRNPLLAAARDEIRALEGSRVTAEKRPNPTFSFQMEDYPIRENPGPFFSNQEITLRFDQEIERGGRRRLRAETAGRAVDIQRLNYRDRVRRTQLEVQRAFTRAVLEKSNLETAQSLLEQTERMISLNRVRFEQGEISALELNRTEAEKLKFQDDVFQSSLLLRNAKSALLALLNAPDLSRDIEIAGALQVDPQIPEHGLPPQIPLPDLIRTALAQRPDMALRLEEKKQADTETLLQRAIRSRNVTVGGGYKRSGPDNSYILGVTIPLNLFNRNEGEIARADADQARAADLLIAAQKSIELDVQIAFNAAETNHHRVEYIRTQHMKKAEEASRVTFASYNLGGATLIDYLDTQRTLRDTLRTYNQALFDERISLYELACSIGTGVE